jgi:hypothetical protein
VPPCTNLRVVQRGECVAPNASFVDVRVEQPEVPGCVECSVQRRIMVATSAAIASSGIGASSGNPCARCARISAGVTLGVTGRARTSSGTVRLHAPRMRRRRSVNQWSVSMSCSTQYRTALGLSCEFLPLRVVPPASRALTGQSERRPDG